jgi:flavodoxin
MKDILVVHFSRTGYTGRIAAHIAGATGADCETIHEQAPRSGLRGYWRSAREALRGSAVDIAPVQFAPRDYRMVVIGTPVWAGNVSSPVRAYIARHRAGFGNVALFCTQGGSGASKVLQKMAGLCDRLPVATAFFNDAEIDADQFLAKADAFCDALRRAAANVSSAPLAAAG